ncbi:MAG: multiheme c-type cytochrome [Desulfobulbaceae bacterium]|nr:multiheme c-type cytochrome [Desulfobulbaceae bacterium]
MRGIITYHSFQIGDGKGKGRRSIFFAVRLLCCFLAAMFRAEGVAAASSVSEQAMHRGSAQQQKSFDASSSCSTCHLNIYDQFVESMHARSYTNPVFKNMFDELVENCADDESLVREMMDCIACHSPVTYLELEGSTFAEDRVNPDISGVECDICHRITGYKGPKPQGGNYIAEPGKQKYGPFPQQSDWHHVYAELQTKSEICAVCHNRINRFGLEIISTFTEWQDSRYARIGIQCQDCHMNSQGFLTGGKAVFESGRATQENLAKSPLRSKLYTHRFPGAHSETQIKGAIKLDIQADASSLIPGEEAVISVIVDNSKSGHRLPTGTAELRLLYLDFYAQIGNRTIPLPASSLYPGMFDVAGKGKYDAEFLGQDFPQGRRLYRAVCVDTAEKQTYYAYNAEKIIFDNRLLADEIRKEFFTFQVPDDISGKVSFVATLYYIRYPDPFAEQLGLPRAGRTELASVRRDVVPGRQPE